MAVTFSVSFDYDSMLKSVLPDIMAFTTLRNSDEDKNYKNMIYGIKNWLMKKENNIRTEESTELINETLELLLYRVFYISIRNEEYARNILEIYDKELENGDISEWKYKTMCDNIQLMYNRMKTWNGFHKLADEKHIGITDEDIKVDSKNKMIVFKFRSNSFEYLMNTETAIFPNTLTEVLEAYGMTANVRVDPTVMPKKRKGNSKRK